MTRPAQAPEIDLFDPEVFRIPPESEQAPAPKPTRQRCRFLKGPVPEPWLDRAMLLPGKALAVGVMLWLQSGIVKQRRVTFCLSRAADKGIPAKTARRAIRALERAGLVAVKRKPGHGLLITILDPDS